MRDEWDDDDNNGTGWTVNVDPPCDDLADGRGHAVVPLNRVLGGVIR